MTFRHFPTEYQLDAKDCGPASLKMIAKYYGRYFSLQLLRDKCGITKEGVSLRGISVAAESIGFHTMAVKCNIQDLINKIPLPAIIFWNENHFVVVYNTNKKYIYVSDPNKGHVKYSIDDFAKEWYLKNEEYGVLLALEPTTDFYLDESERKNRADGVINILGYLKPYKRYFALILFIMTLATLLQGLLPFISKAVIDVGIRTTDIKFINIILIGNICILISIMVFNVIRDWILMHITARVNISLISDYLIKLMKLPVTFFENKLIGDILQRAQDHERIRSFIMNNSLSLVFSSLTFGVFSIILLFYNPIIFYIFIFGSILFVLWVLMFLRIRKKLDWKYFELISKNQSFWVETVSAIQDIKIYNYECARRWKWEKIQTKLYHLNKKLLGITNAQNLGSQFIDNIKNMTITFYCATAVIRGEITFGVMISTQFILGMLNGPLIQFINFIVSAQYAKISFLRMNEIRQLEDEEDLLSVSSSTVIPEDRSLRLNNVMFQYANHLPFVLKNIYLYIPENKITAIVGASGCGKSTLLKLLIRLYKPSYGTISIGKMNVSAINLRKWREMCGVVMQDGKIFTDTIQNNIILDTECVDYERLRRCCQMAQIAGDIEGMPRGYDTEIGEQGRGLSGGQKQRLLIARALYHNPSYLFLDEATNALDTINEQKIVTALNSAFENRTVVIVAHRLSTIRNAHQIVVMDQGQIIEVGNHETLMNKKGAYHKMLSAQAANI